MYFYDSHIFCKYNNKALDVTNFLEIKKKKEILVVLRILLDIRFSTSSDLPKIHFHLSHLKNNDYDLFQKD